LLTDSVRGEEVRKTLERSPAMAIEGELDSEGREPTGISRRRVLQGAVAGGALVWTAPVIDSVMSGASAASTPIGNAPFSYVAIQLTCGGDVFDVKYNSPTFNYTDTGNGGACGSFATPCGGGAFSTFVANSSLGCPSTTQLSQQATFSADLSQMSVIVGAGCTITGYVIHRGTCCCGPLELSFSCSESEPAAPAGPGTVTFNMINNKAPC
jgi:hypothetical protein